METKTIRPKFGGLSDTAPEAQKVWIDLLRKAGSARRTMMAFNLSHTAMELSKRAIRRANPQLSEFEVKIRFLALCHGEELAQKVEAVMIQKGINANT